MQDIFKNCMVNAAISAHQGTFILFCGYLCLLLPILSKIFLWFQTKIEKMVDHMELMQNEVFLAFASYATIVLSKMMFLSFVTGFYRITRKVSHLEAIFLLRVKILECNFLNLLFFFHKAWWHII